jgi:small ligand-binding sensory domain FIST
MEFTSAATTEADADQAIRALVEQISIGEPDLLVMFLSTYHSHAAEYIVRELRQALQPGLLIGCTAEGVIDPGREIEDQPAISLVAARLPEASLTPFVLQSDPTEWHNLLLEEDNFYRAVPAPADTRLMLMLADPFTTPMEDALQAFNLYYPGIPIVGGMASGSLRPHGNTVFVNDRVYHEGAVGAAISGAVDVDIIVSQGCRPIWRPFKVVKAHQNVIHNLEDRAPLAWLQDLIPELSDEDRALLQNGLFVGRAVKAGQESLGRGDFVIRGVMGIDQESGAIAIGDSIMDGETIQFHLRDAVTAQEDLEMMLIPQMFRETPSGALLFTCNGRGTRLYDRPNGDITIIQQNVSNAPLAGFFCAGEIGPIGGANFLHGHTATLVLFRPADIDP